jgi:hypothetical protein
MNGHESLRDKCFARAKTTTPMPATNTFKINAVEDMIAGAIVKNERIAKYPDAPPCPTEEYNAATKKIRIAITKRRESSISFFLFDYFTICFFPTLPWGTPSVRTLIKI